MKQKIMCAIMFVALIFSLPGCARTQLVLSDNSNLVEVMQKRFQMQNGTDFLMQMSIHEEFSKGKLKYVLTDCNGQVGLIQLKKAINGSYSVERLSSGDSDFQGEIFSEGDNTYFLLAGRDEENQIASATVVIDDVHYSMEIPEQEYFISCVEVCPTQGSYLVYFYNAAGEDITELIQ